MNFISNFFARTFRPRSIIPWLILIIIFYIVINNFLFKWSDNDLNEERKFGSYKRQLDFIKKRINILEKDLDRSNHNAKQLENLMKNFNEMIIDENERKANSSSEFFEIFNRKNQDKIPILVFACNRPNAIENHLNQLIEKRALTNQVEKFPIIVSQDCFHEPTARTINKYLKHLYAFIQQPDRSDITRDEKGNLIATHMRGYFKIARHYKWALEYMFMKPFTFQSVIITEDDLNIAVDFFGYFEAMHKVLIQDPSLFCVSAWNDNGKSELIDQNKSDLVHRSDFFPGLGWMLTRSFWIEIRKKWPKSFWDDWLRENAQRKNRSCLRPEISRTEMSIKSAKNGVSSGQFFDNYLKFILMNQKPIKWSEIDTRYLLKNNYDEEFYLNVYNKTVEIKFDELVKILETKTKDDSNYNESYLLVYKDKDEFLKYANHFSIMNDFKNGVPRTAYKGVVRIMFKKKQIYIAPNTKLSWSGYVPTW